MFNLVMRAYFAFQEWPHLEAKRLHTFFHWVCMCYDNIHISFKSLMAVTLAPMASLETQ